MVACKYSLFKYFNNENIKLFNTRFRRLLECYFAYLHYSLYLYHNKTIPNFIMFVYLNKHLPCTLKTILSTVIRNKNIVLYSNFEYEMR